MRQYATPERAPRLCRGTVDVGGHGEDSRQHAAQVRPDDDGGEVVDGAVHARQDLPVRGPGLENQYGGDGERDHGDRHASVKPEPRSHDKGYQHSHQQRTDGEGETLHAVIHEQVTCTGA